MNGDTQAEIRAIAEKLRELDPELKNKLVKVIEAIEPFDLQDAMGRLVHAGMNLVDEGTGYFRAEGRCNDGMVMREYGVTVWQDGTLEGTRETVLNGRERKCVVKGVDLHIQGHSTDHTVFRAKCSTTQQMMHVVEAIRICDGRGNSNSVST